MVDTAKRMGKKAVALITDMDQPLGKLAGHSNEVIESIEVLKGRGPKDLRDLSLELSAWMFFLGERTASLDEGRRLAETMVASDKRWRNFGRELHCRAAIHASSTTTACCCGESQAGCDRSNVRISGGDELHGIWNCAGDARRRARNERRQDRSRCGAGVSQADWRPRGKGRTAGHDPLQSAAKLDEAKRESPRRLLSAKTKRRKEIDRGDGWRLAVLFSLKVNAEAIRAFASSSFAAEL